MKISTLVFAATILGATAAIDHPGLDLERRELDLARRELEFEHKARAWMAARDVKDTLNPRAVCSGYCGYPTMPQCSAGCICQRGSCVSMSYPSPPDDNRAGKPKNTAKPKNAVKPKNVAKPKGRKKKST